MRLTKVVMTHPGPGKLVPPLTGGPVEVAPHAITVGDESLARRTKTRLVFRVQGVQIETKSRRRAPGDLWREYRLEIQSVTVTEEGQ